MKKLFEQPEITVLSFQTEQVMVSGGGSGDAYSFSIGKGTDDTIIMD